MKKIYAFAWIFLAAAVVITALTGSFSAAAVVIFSLTALALVYALALWSVFTNVQEIKTG